MIHCQWYIHRRTSSQRLWTWARHTISRRRDKTMIILKININWERTQKERERDAEVNSDCWCCVLWARRHLLSNHKLVFWQLTIRKWCHLFDSLFSLFVCFFFYSCWSQSSSLLCNAIPFCLGQIDVQVNQQFDDTHTHANRREIPKLKHWIWCLRLCIRSHQLKYQKWKRWRSKWNLETSGWWLNAWTKFFCFSFLFLCKEWLNGKTFDWNIVTPSEAEAILSNIWL